MASMRNLPPHPPRAPRTKGAAMLPGYRTMLASALPNIVAVLRMFTQICRKGPFVKLCPNLAATLDFFSAISEVLRSWQWHSNGECRVCEQNRRAGKNEQEIKAPDTSIMDCSITGIPMPRLDMRWSCSSGFDLRTAARKHLWFLQFTKWLRARCNCAHQTVSFYSWRSSPYSVFYMPGSFITTAKKVAKLVTCVQILVRISTGPCFESFNLVELHCELRRKTLPYRQFWRKYCPAALHRCHLVHNWQATS